MMNTLKYQTHKFSIKIALKKNGLLVFSALLIYGYIFAADIPGSKNGKLLNNTGHSKCSSCHVSDEKNEDVTPLWGNVNLETEFNTFENSSFSGNINQPAGNSKLCLSCHDGTIGTDDIGGNGVALPKQFSNNGVHGNHPISFQYNSITASKKRSLHDPSVTPSGLGGTIEQDMLQNGKMECTSCHDIHKLDNENSYLIKSNYKSALCLTCHNK